jgi:hypothetical protein
VDETLHRIDILSEMCLQPQLLSRLKSSPHNVTDQKGALYQSGIRPWGIQFVPPRVPMEPALCLQLPYYLIGRAKRIEGHSQAVDIKELDPITSRSSFQLREMANAGHGGLLEYRILSIETLPLRRCPGHLPLAI